MASLDLNGIAKSYDGQRAVDGIDLHIPDGALACLLGPSGCGKTTTLRLIAGFMSPDAGEIRVGGEVLSSPARTTPPEARRMSMVFQSYALWPHMTVARNVAYGLELRGMARDDIRRRVDSILAVTRIGALAERYPGELSGGQQQRAALARALAVEPQTLLLDEPLSNLDANLREEMRFEIRRLHQEYKYTTVYVTHDQAEAMTAADLIVVMNGGKIEQVGSPEEVYRHPRSRFVAGFIGGANILEGRALARDTVAVDGMMLRCAEGEAGNEPKGAKPERQQSTAETLTVSHRVSSRCPILPAPGSARAEDRRRSARQRRRRGPSAPSPGAAARREARRGSPGSRRDRFGAPRSPGRRWSRP